MTACTWISSKWPDPAFGSRAVVRCYVGGVGDEDVLDADDGDLVEACARHLSPRSSTCPPAAAGIVGRPVDRAMPQYEVGHLERVRAIRRNLPAGMFVVGSAYDGVGIPDCVRGGGRDGRAGPRAPRPDRRSKRRRLDDVTPRPNDGSIFALYPAFRARDGFRDLSADALADVVQEVENLYKAFDGRVEVRGTYSTVGFRPDADLMLWLVGTAAEDVQAFLAEFRRTQAGRLTDIAWTFMGVVKPAEFTPDHQPAFVKGDAAEDVPVRLPVRADARVVPAASRGARRAARRARRCRPRVPRRPREHDERVRAGRLGVDPGVRGRPLDVDRRLHPPAARAKARLYTKVEVPFVTGIRKSVADAFADLA